MTAPLQSDTIRSANQLLTTEEASRVLGVCPKTLVRWRCEGVGPDYFKMNRLVRYDLGELERYKQSTRITSSVRAHREEQRVSL